MLKNVECTVSMIVILITLFLEVFECANFSIAEMFDSGTPVELVAYRTDG